ncbi:MAG: M20/M25/M40 family metallo-hydrolase [Negativicutes bacterium]
MLKWNDPAGLEKLLLELVGQNSVSGTRNEQTMAELVHRLLGTLPYFAECPQNLFIKPLNDKLGRSFVAALLDKGKCKETLIFVGHMDTVDIEDYGPLRSLAFKPYEYMQAIKDGFFGNDAAADLATGEWLFGRGVMDMKCGVAMQMALLEQLAADKGFKGNVLLLTVPDEETNSEGALAAVKFANELLSERKLQAQVVVNCEPNFASYPGDDNRYVYLGTVGKLLPGFYFVGKETHVGESLSGINPDFIAAEFLRRVEVNTDFSDYDGAEMTLPPICLKFKDLKELYSVQTPIAAAMYYNLQTFNTTPETAIEKFRVVAKDALDAACTRVLEQAAIYKNRTKLPVKELHFNPQVLNYSEFCKIVAQGDANRIERVVNDCIEKYSQLPDVDERELNIRIISALYEICPLREPMIIMFFAPPYYPHVSLKTAGAFERHLLSCADRLTERAKTEYGEAVLKQRYFQGLSDLSYFAVQDAEAVIDGLAPNMPSWGRTYSVPVEEIRKLNLPVINFGPHGRDPHKSTERLHKKYSFEKAPLLLRTLIDDIFDFFE